MVGISIEPPVVGRDWSPVSSNKPVVAGVELRVGHRALVQSGRAARRYLRIRGKPRADARGPGAGLAPGLQALPMPAAARVLFVGGACVVFGAWTLHAEAKTFYFCLLMVDSL